MDCSDIRKILHEHVEGNGDLKQQALIEEHLRSCEQCMRSAVDIRKTINMLQDLDEVEPPAWLTSKVMKKIRAEAQPRKLWIERLFFPLHIKLPLEAFAAVLITVAAIFIFKNMEPELHKMEVQPQAPALKSVPVEPGQEMRKEEMQDKTVQPQRLQEEAKQKDSPLNTETRDLALLKEEKPVGRSVPAPAAAPTMPEPSSSFAPSPALSPAMRHAETGKAAGMAARDETMQRAAPVSELSAAKKAAALPIVTLMVKTPDAARKEIETYMLRNRGELKTIEQSESRIIIMVGLDPARINKFVEFLSGIGTFKEERQALSIQSSSFKLIIEKQ